MQTSLFLAVDLGAGSCRIVAALWKESSLTLHEIHRFPTPLVERGASLRWDFERIWKGLIDGLSKVSPRFPRDRIVGIGVDSWAVDYAYVDERGELLALPHAYRDPRTRGLAEAVEARIGREKLFARTGLQFLPFNTLYQCAADVREDPAHVCAAFRLLLIADLVSFRLCGRMVAERTNASTTQFYNPVTREWDLELTGAIGLPSSILPKLVDSGTPLGLLRAEVMERTRLPELSVIAVASHDTASAVVAVPAQGADFAYLSLGTWALLGTEIAKPLLDAAVQRLNFTNETGFGGTIRLLKNITGLWIVQECRRIWIDEDGTEPEYATLSAWAAKAPALRFFIDPDAPEFAGRCDMPEAIREFCRRTGQPVPEGRGSALRTAVDSLALKVAVVLRQLESLTGKRYPALHVVGGGAQDALLMRAIANAVERPVLAGPVEATALGNALVQMMGGGAVGSLEEARAIVRTAFPPADYLPENADDWRAARERFEELVGRVEKS